MSANTCPLCLNLCLPSKDLVSLISKVLIKKHKIFSCYFLPSVCNQSPYHFIYRFRSLLRRFHYDFRSLQSDPRTSFFVRNTSHVQTSACSGLNTTLGIPRRIKYTCWPEGLQDFYKYFIRWLYLFLSQISDSSSWSVAHSHCQKPVCVASFRGWILVPVQFSAYRIIIVS